MWATVGSECSVVLLDHGTTEVVSLDCIRELCTKLQQIPKQAVLCKWNGFGCHIEGAYETLKKTLNPFVEQNIELLFVSYSEASQIWVVEITINGVFLQQPKKTYCLKCSGKDRMYSACTHSIIMDKLPVDESIFAQRLSLAPVELDLGHTGFAAAVTAPCDFHIVLEDMLLFMSMVATILETLPEDLDSMPEAVLVPGTGCLVKCETKNKWCRAEIVHVDSISVVMNLVDYGHCTRLPCTRHDQLKRLPEELAKLPKVTYPCVLRGVTPAGGDVWTDEAVVFFQERICEKSLLIYFRQDVSETQCEVDIVSGGVNVAVELVAAGHATYIDSILGLGLQQGQSPIRAPLKFVPRIVRNTIKFEPEPQPAEAKDALVLAELELDRNAHRPEYADQGNRQTTDDFKSQMSDEAKARQRGEEASADEQFSTERTTRLTEQIPAKGKCIQM
ncbi:tudor domain-containing protein 15 [Conger conger]|uniref:tudor domain-containing protein 15 n=1 Tax=Conger conger TaxID=82655 RepID=UPI002A5A092B|nr:tudor domain-containing protein 15 [Conger conger]